MNRGFYCILQDLDSLDDKDSPTAVAMTPIPKSVITEHERVSSEQFTSPGA